MLYLDLYNILVKNFYKKEVSTHIPELNINIEHHSFNSDNLWKNTEIDSNTYNDSSENIVNSHILEASDADIESNFSFTFHIIKNPSETKSKGVIFLFHGLNEKKWDKYLPWAYELAKRTEKAVILFPICFHMERAHELWSDRTKMNNIAKERAAKYKDNSDCSFVNAAISYRLEKQPQRLFWSGLQTYSDIVTLIKQIRADKFNSIHADANINLFGYSIGSFLSMILMMANPNDYFSQSKFFCFCGGMTLDRMLPISKYIMDARSSIALQKNFATLLSSDFATTPLLAHYQNDELNPEESWFKTMLKYDYFQERRENRIAELHDRIKAFVLEKDTVTPPIETLNTLKGGYRNIPTEVQIEDFEYPYSHINPFPVTIKNAEKIDDSFKLFIKSASAFLR